MMNSPKRSAIESVARIPSKSSDGTQQVHDNEGDRADHDGGPDGHPPGVLHARGGDQRPDRYHEPGQVAERPRPVLGCVGPVYGGPLPDEHCEQRGVDECELLPVGARCVPGEDGEHGENPHLQEDERAVATVLAAVQLVELGTVEPADPDQPEDDGEIEHARPRDVLGQRVRYLADQHHVDEVVEELEEADRAVLDHLAVRPGRPQEPTTQPLAQRHGRTGVRSPLAHLVPPRSLAAQLYVVPDRPQLQLRQTGRRRPRSGPRICQARTRSQIEATGFDPAEHIPAHRGRLRRRDG